MKRTVLVLLMIMCLVPFHFSVASGDFVTELRDLMVDNPGWLSEDDLSGYANFMLWEGETWVNLGLFEDTIIGMAWDSEGRTGLRIVNWDSTAFGEIIASPMWNDNWWLNKYHSVSYSLELIGDDGLVQGDVYLDRGDDGTWRLTGVNNGWGVYVRGKGRGTPDPPGPDHHDGAGCGDGVRGKLPGC